MTITYRTAGVWGAGKGANLTPAEVDANFYDHEQRIAAIESNPPSPVEISNITQSGSQITFHKEDATEYGPFTLPTARYNPRGVWAAATYYAANDTVEIEAGADAGLYIVLISHTSAATFDPGATSGGDAIYFAAASGGGAGTGIAGVITKPNDEYTYSPALGEEGYLFRGDAPGDQTFQIPLDSTTDFAIGTVFYVQAWYGLVEVEAAAVGVDIWYPHRYYSRTRSYYSVLTIIKTAANEWAVTGDMQPAYWPPIMEWPNNTLSLTYNRESAEPVLYNFTDAGGCTVTVPADQGFDFGMTFELRQGAAGAVVLSPAGGVTILHISGSTYTTTGVGAVMTLRLVDVNKWLLTGDAA